MNVPSVVAWYRSCCPSECHRILRSGPLSAGMHAERASTMNLYRMNNVVVRTGDRPHDRSRGCCIGPRVRCGRRECKRNTEWKQWRLTGGAVRPPRPILFDQGRDPSCTQRRRARDDDEQDRQEENSVAMHLGSFRSYLAQLRLASSSLSYSSSHSLSLSLVRIFSVYLTPARGLRRSVGLCPSAGPFSLAPGDISYFAFSSLGTWCFNAYSVSGRLRSTFRVSSLLFSISISLAPRVFARGPTPSDSAGLSRARWRAALSRRRASVGLCRRSRGTGLLTTVHCTKLSALLYRHCAGPSAATFNLLSRL